MTDKKIQFTPGPWKYDPERFNTDNEQNSGSILSVGSDEWFIAEICGDLDESQANAKLIAAAPEMYELIEALLDENPSPEQLRQEAFDIKTKINS
jgi:hypothetical protein